MKLPPDDLPPTMSTFAREVLDLVDAIPPGRVMSYGEVSAHLGGPGPRMVARVMSTWGDAVPWWRVLRADGSCAPGVKARQMRLLRAEGAVLRSKDRVDMAASRHLPPE
ncbi:MAG: Methylated-DNA-(protein)-cysteine S-methyltransferase binding protein [Myxococcaceae bacterium]|nr:Methylated-DNA-(protein)-cysteine S-methyltransferase binding protein [Myxococcaceae bacterium]